MAYVSSSSTTVSVENYLLIWIDANIDESSEDCQYTLAQLRRVVNNVCIFTKPNKCIQFLKSIENEKVFMITWGALGEKLVPKIHSLSQLDAIYIFCGNKTRHQQWAKDWIKVKGIYTNINDICDALHTSVKQSNHDHAAISFITADQVNSSTNLNQLEASYMYTQIFKEILLGMEYDRKSIKQLINYCRELYKHDAKELKLIREFKHKYEKKSPIWWYTRECFTYHMLNQALRTLDGLTIIKMGFFIRSLHEHIEKLYQKQVNTYRGKIFTVYRGQGLSKDKFDELIKSKNGLLSFNNFLSTSRKQEVALKFVKVALKRPDTIGLLFKISVDPSVLSAPYASIQEVSYYREEEILFSMHTVFRVGQIDKLDNNKAIYQVDLKLTSDNDQQLRILTERIRKEVVGETGWKRLGQLLLKLGQIDKAEELYNALFEQTSDSNEIAHYYHQLGYIKQHQGDHEQAIEYYEKGLEIQKETLPSNHPDIATSYNNIGSLYDNIQQYAKAFSFYVKAIEIRQNILPQNHSSLATSYSNIGLVCCHIGEYSKSLTFYDQALAIWQKTLPSNHPNIATSYNNIGLVYKNMGDNSKALSYYQEALEIWEKSLPSNHPSLAASFSNIAGVYMNVKENSIALSYLQRALDIYESSLPSNHPNVQKVLQAIETMNKLLN